MKRLTQSTLSADVVAFSIKSKDDENPFSAGMEGAEWIPFSVNAPKFGI